jgi:hypothetical protein
VQDEASVWRPGKKHPIRYQGSLSGLTLLTQQFDSNNQKSDNTQKQTLRTWLPLTWKIYSVVRQQLGLNQSFESNRKDKQNLSNEELTPKLSVTELSRSAITWADWSVLNGENFGYQPRSIEGGLKSIENRIAEIVTLAHARNSKVYLFTYPWPAQVVHQSDEKFAFNKWVRKTCETVKCEGYLPIYEEIMKDLNQSPYWYRKFYIDSDVHFNANGNRQIAMHIASYISSKFYPEN